MAYRLSEFLSNQWSRPFLTVLGYPIEHSLSPLIHQHALDASGIDWDYVAVSVPEDERELLPELFRHEYFRGSNVTLPLKERIPELVDKTDDEVSAIGAANTVYFGSGGELKAANTDVYGFLQPLWPYADQLRDGSALILGSGGAARAVSYGLSQRLKMESLSLISRNPGNIDADTFPGIESSRVFSYSELSKLIDESQLIVNTTPLGMHPNTEESPVPGNSEDYLKSKICYDLIYRPYFTAFLEQARQAGGRPVYGLPMFVHQAARSFEIWTGESFPVDKAEEIIRTQIYA